MTTLPISSIAALTPQTNSSASSSVAAPSTTLASENVFLQLLVAQLKNQDPSQPTDGTAFVTELAQFTTLQEDSQSATDLDKIVSLLTPATTTTPPTTATAASTASTNNTTNPINQ